MTWGEYARGEYALGDRIDCSTSTTRPTGHSTARSRLFVASGRRNVNETLEASWTYANDPNARIGYQHPTLAVVRQSNKDRQILLVPLAPGNHSQYSRNPRVPVGILHRLHTGIPVKRHRGEPGHTPGHTGHTGTDGHTDHTDEPHNHPNPTTHPQTGTSTVPALRPSSDRPGSQREHYAAALSTSTACWHYAAAHKSK